VSRAARGAGHRAAAERSRRAACNDQKNLMKRGIERIEEWWINPPSHRTITLHDGTEREETLPFNTFLIPEMWRKGY